MSEQYRWRDEKSSAEWEIDGPDSLRDVTNGGIYNLGMGLPVAIREIQNLVEENARLIKALHILALEMYINFRNDDEMYTEDLRTTLEAAGLIEMLPDQSWVLTKLGDKVCRREP